MLKVKSSILLMSVFCAFSSGVLAQNTKESDMVPAGLYISENKVVQIVFERLNKEGERTFETELSEKKYAITPVASINEKLDEVE